VYVSSIEAINLKNPLRPISEEHGFADSNAVMEYGDTKAEASRMIAEAGRKDASTGNGPETVLICPTGIIGPWDYHNGLFTTMIRRYLKGEIPAAVPGGFDFVDVREVAGAVLAAAEGRGRSGEMYLASGHNLPVPELFKIIDKVTEKKRHIPVLPLWLGRLAGEFTEMWSRISGSEALFTKGSIDILQVDARINNNRAEKELGYRARSSEETIRDTVDWIQKGLDPDSAPEFKKKASGSVAV
jgi:dihydroflavonol-4-reductase